MTNEANRGLIQVDGGWPWAGTICAAHGTLVFALAYSRLASIIGFSTDALLWLHWLWLGWPITGAWRGTRYAVGAAIPFWIGLLAWIASCYFAIWNTLSLFMHT